MKDTFIVYSSYLERFAKLSDEHLGMLFRAMLEYQSTGIEPQIDDITVSVCFNVVKFDMDANNEKYEQMCERQRRNVQKRWEKKTTEDNGIPNDTTVYHGIPLDTTNTYNDSDNESDNDSDTESDNESVEKETANAVKKESKHRYGQYMNVLLTDTEMQKLQEEFPSDWQERIERLSEYIESKGAKYKNHLATIRAWARKDKERKQNTEQTPYGFAVIDSMDF